MSPERTFSKRSANFNSCEIEFLIQTVTKYRDVIESKKTDRSAAEEKAKAWKDVEREFNAQFGNFSFRTTKVLRTKYDNLKKNAKKSIRYIRKANAASSTEDAASLEQMAYMDESHSTDKLFNDTVREYFEETFTENDNSKSPWHENEDEYGIADEDKDIKQNVPYEVPDGPLLVPMVRKPVENGANDFTMSKPNRKTYRRSIESGEALCNNINFATKAERHAHNRLQEKEEPAYSRNSHNSHFNERSPMGNSRKEAWRQSNSIQNKTSIQLFCDSLAMQIEEANLTSYQLSSLQIDFLKKLQEYLPNEN